jgi:hypothetical protein
VLFPSQGNLRDGVAQGDALFRPPLLTLASSPGSDRIRVLHITLQSLARLNRWVDLGCGESEATASVAPPARVHRTSVDVVEPVSPPDGFVRAEIPAFVAEHTFGAGCLVSLLDVIEHFPRTDALALLDVLERKFGVVAIFTPDGFYTQDATTNPDFADKPYQWHRSGWTKGEFVERGYAVVSFPQLHMGFGGFAAIKVNEWPRLDYLRWRLGVERLRMQPFLTPRTMVGAWKEHVRFRHGDSWWYAALRRRNRGG